MTWSAFEVCNDVQGRGLHVIPDNDFVAHDLDILCDCCPFEDDDMPELWIHNAADKREEYEKGRLVSWQLLNSRNLKK